MRDRQTLPRYPQSLEDDPCRCRKPNRADNSGRITKSFCPMREALSLTWTAFANLTEAGLLEDVPRSRLGWSGNSSGQPSMTVTPVLRELLDTCLREEAVALSKAIWISLGPKATQGIEWIIQQGAL